MTTNQNGRLWVVIVALVGVTLVITGRLVVFQLLQANQWEERGRDTQVLEVIARPDRGIIYDRNNAVLAANGADYQIGASPSLVVEAGEIATALAPILEEPRYEILAKLESSLPFVLLSNRVSSEIAEAIRTLDYEGIQIDSLPRRIYPQGESLCHTLGYADLDGVGGAGLEGFYQAELAGEAASAYINISPLEEQETVLAREGVDLVLTIDRSVQYIVEQQLNRAIREYGAEGGTMIVMDPKTGAILAMANAPCYDPYAFYEAQAEVLNNPSVSQAYEPGSVMKLVTMAAALDSGAVNSQSTYYDSGVYELGGAKVYNSDRSGPGITDMKTLIARSLNVGATHLAVETGTDTFYNYMERFGFGRRTGIDLMSEAAGQMFLPGSEYWTESSLATNSFGQGISVTPLQMVSAISALANEGYLMQPYIVQEIHAGEDIFTHEPKVLSRPITPEAAQQVTAMAVHAINTEIWRAQIQGYTVAGKTGTAQIPENGIYHPTDTIASFVGWLPADSPEIAVLIKLDRPSVSPWGSETAAPAFAELANELVVLLDIPPDAIRLKADIMAARSQEQ